MGPTFGNLGVPLYGSKINRQILVRCLRALRLRTLISILPERKIFEINVSILVVIPIKGMWVSYTLLYLYWGIWVWIALSNPHPAAFYFWYIDFESRCPSFTDEISWSCEG